MTPVLATLLLLLQTQAPPSDLLTEPEASPPPEPYVLVEVDGPDAAAPATEGSDDGSDESAALPRVQPGRLLVLDVVDQTGGGAGTIDLNETIGAQATATHDGQTLTTGALVTKLDEAALQALSRCEDEACAATAAIPVEAEFVIGGSLTRAGDDHLLSLLLVRTQTGERIRSAQHRFAASDGVTARWVAQHLTAKVLGGALADTRVPVVFDADVEGADIVVNGTPMGATPTTMMLEPGSYAVSFSSPGEEDWRADVTVVAETPQRASAVFTAFRLPVWAFAASTGAVSVVSLSVASVFWLLAQSAYDGTLGDPASSYQGNPAPDTAFLAEKKRDVRTNALIGDVAGGVGVTLLAATVVLAAWEVTLLATGE